MQLSWELQTSRGRRVSSTEVHFGQLEVLECLWPRGASEPEYAEVRADSLCAWSAGPGGEAGRGGSPAIFPVPTQILSFPNSLRSQASAQPCAHLRHTQTLRRVPKVTHPTPGLGALGCLLWVLPPTSHPWCFPAPTLYPIPCAPSRAHPPPRSPEIPLGHVHAILSAPLLAHDKALPAHRTGGGRFWAAWLSDSSSL